MNKNLLYGLTAIALSAVLILTGCNGGRPITEMQAVAVVERGDLEVKVSVDGNIEMPEAVSLYFDTTMFSPPYSARVKKVYVEKGDVVKAGALLAKLDDTAQKLGVESAQYALELAINNVVQTVCCGTTRSPGFYSDAVALERYELALKELQKALKWLSTDGFEDAASQIALARYDLEAARKIYLDPEYRSLRKEFNDLNQQVLENPDFELAVACLTSELESLSLIAQQIGRGDYVDARAAIKELLIRMSETQSVIKRTTHLPGAIYTYPDTCTTFTLVNEVLLSLNELQKMAAAGEINTVKFNEMLSLAVHDLELSDKILDENVSTFRQGLNMKALRDYNIGIQTAIVNLQRAKQVLLKTELLAPFDGEIVDVNLRDGDMITQRYSVTGLAIDTYILKIANRGSVRMAGVVDEIDVIRLNKGKEALVTIDAMPGKALKGRVRFISPFGTLQTGVATYRVEITLDPAEVSNLTGGLTATAEVLLDKRVNVVIVPRSALYSKGKDWWVYVVNNEKAGQAEQRPVMIGAESRTQAEILSGLQPGEKVLLQRGSPSATSLKVIK
jgi:HlyD family secretion protein